MAWHGSHNVLICRFALRAVTPEDMDVLWRWVRTRFLISDSEKSVGGQVRFAVPIQREEGASQELLDGANMGRLFKAIDAEKAAVGVKDYSIGHTTLDQVFLNVVERHGADEESNEAVRKKGVAGRLFGR